MLSDNREPISPEVYRRVRELFDTALELAEADRPAFLHGACSDTPEVFDAVTHLLEAHVSARSFLDGGCPALRRLGRYLIAGELGRGAMGTVYDAVDPLIGRRVALKVVRSDALEGGADATPDQLFREVRAAGRLMHPGIVVVFDVGQQDGSSYFAMEKVEGPSLAQEMASGRRIDPVEAVAILRQTAAALDYAHRQGIVHRDIKPGNIMLGDGGIVKVADFGIAKFLAGQYRTATGAVWGTPSYMPPEQIQGRAVDGRADQYSLAVVAYELLTRKKPFEADSLAALATVISSVPPPSACTVNPSIPPNVDEVLRRGLAKLPQDRYASCKDLADALSVAYEPTPRVQESTSTSQAVVSIRSRVRSRALAALGVLTALTLIAVVLRWSPAWKRGDVGNRAIPTQPVSSKVPADPSKLPGTSDSSPRSGGAGGTIASRGALSNDKEAEARRLYEQAVSRHDVGLLRRAAEMNYAQAMVAMGESCMDTHQERGAVEWFRRAAEAGDSSGMLHLGGMYQLGMGVPQNYRTAIYWYRKASDEGSAAAMFDLGSLYENGRGVAVDLRKARELYQQAATRGNSEAQAALLAFDKKEKE
jgi:serine/threonine protein kinase